MEVGPPEAPCRGSPQTTAPLLRLRAAVVNSAEKANYQFVRCEPGRRTQVNRRRRVETFFRRHQNREWVPSSGSAWEISAYCPDGVRHKGGASLAWALMWNVRTCDSEQRWLASGSPPSY